MVVFFQNMLVIVVQRTYTLLSLRSVAPRVVALSSHVHYLYGGQWVDVLFTRYSKNKIPMSSHNVIIV